jgi:hypothetical protein
MKNKRSVGWTKAWFYFKFPLDMRPRGAKTAHAHRSHMSALNFRMKPSVQDLSDDSFIWACKNIGGRDAVEEFISCGVWPLSAGVSFEHVKVGLTPASQLKVPLPHFSLLHEDGEDDPQLLVRVKQEARNIVGSYTHAEHEACITSLLNNDHLNHVLDVVGVSHEPCPVPISAEFLKKRKADGAAKISSKCPKVTEKKSVTPVKVSGSCTSARSMADAAAADKFAKLRKATIPRVIASATAACVMPRARILEV